MRDFLETALDAIRSNRLRSVLTILIIAIGITSLVGIQTSIEILSRELSDSFGRMGLSKVTIEAGEKAPPLSIAQASLFTGTFTEAVASASLVVNPIARASSCGVTTDPVVTLTASDGNWLECNGYTLAAGRNFSRRELSEGAAVCLAGASLAEAIAGKSSPESLVGEEISFGSGACRVIGILERHGADFTPGADALAIIPLNNAKGLPAGSSAGCTVTFLAAGESESASIESAGRTMRKIRRIAPGSKDDFTLRTGDAFEETLTSLREKLSAAALAIGLITLLGASAGLTNIMLVSVRERRMEIGLRKALGARKGDLARQFLFEAFLICQAGGLLGVILGTAAGNIVAAVLGAAFVFPLKWLAVALLICLVVGLLSGSLPAGRAAGMDPVEALRYE